MLVILRENVANLGRTGDVVTVSDGYARNFLLPRKLVVAASEENIAEMEHNKKLLAKKRAAQKVVSQEFAKKIEAATVVITRKVGEHDKLFGSVSTADIANAAKAAGLTIEKREIELGSPIKTLGVHNVTVNLESDVSATLKVSVVKEA